MVPAGGSSRTNTSLRPLPSAAMSRAEVEPRPGSVPFGRDHRPDVVVPAVTTRERHRDVDRLAGEPIAMVDLEAITPRGRRRRKDDDPAVARDRHLAGIGQVAGQQRGPSEIPLAYVDVAGEVRVARREVRPEGDERDHVAVGGDGGDTGQPEPGLPFRVTLTSWFVPAGTLRA